MAALSRRSERALSERHRLLIGLGIGLLARPRIHLQHPGYMFTRAEMGAGPDGAHRPALRGWAPAPPPPTADQERHTPEERQ
jgi:hypothetical protein